MQPLSIVERFRFTTRVFRISRVCWMVALSCSTPVLTESPRACVLVCRYCKHIIQSLEAICGYYDVEVSNFYFHLGTTYKDLAKALGTSHHQKGTQQLRGKPCSYERSLLTCTNTLQFWPSDTSHKQPRPLRTVAIFEPSAAVLNILSRSRPLKTSSDTRTRAIMNRPQYTIEFDTHFFYTLCS